MKNFIFKKIIGNKVLIFFTHAILIAIVSYVDYRLDSTISLIILYILPIASVSWLLGKYSGIFVSILAIIPELTVSLFTMASPDGLFINVWNITCKLGIYILIAYLMSSVKKLRESERDLVRTDFLTGINNISYFYELGDVELERVRRSGIPLTIVYIDIDDLRSINDTFGFLEGDRLLQLVAKSIKCNLRITDTAARLDSDEFAILLPGSDFNNSEIVIKRIHRILNDVINGNNWPATVTVGAVTYLSAPESIDHLVTHAEELMYTAKQTGHNNIMHNVITKLQLIVDEENRCDRQK
jgi:diguanylate cyclase (GGDEF)-like protein